MNRTLFSLCLFCAMCLTQSASAQITVKVTPLEPILGKLSTAVELAGNNKNSVMIEYQKWFERRSFSLTSNSILGGSTTNAWRNEVQGFRLYGHYRHYTDSVGQGAFMETGLYYGKHQISTYRSKETTSSGGLFGIDPSTEWSMSAEQEGVKVAGTRLGAGYVKTLGNYFSMEFSGGVNLNFYNSAEFRPTFSTSLLIPYCRIGIGFVIPVKIATPKEEAR